MTRAERIERTAGALVYCHDNGHDVLNIVAVLDLYKTYSLETCEKALERAKEIIKERGEQ